MVYRRTVEQLETVASRFWPVELSEQEAKRSIMPTLLNTQDVFISILCLPVADIENTFNIIDNSTMPPGLFLKHLMVLADFGGEMFQRINKDFDTKFPNRSFTYLWNMDENRAEERVYKFRVLPVKNLNNSKLGVAGRRLMHRKPLPDLQKDAIALLLMGSAAVNEDVANVFAKCEIGQFLGKRRELEQFIRKRYIEVSRITRGSQSNTLGQLAQQFVQSYLHDRFGNEVTITSNGKIPGVRHTDDNDDRETTFDIVLERNGSYVAIEVSFQVTTNSVIERKSGQARGRYDQIHQMGHKIAYVLDGAGNFQRTQALKTICDHSHCTVAFSTEEMQLLGRFVSECFEID